MIDPFNPPQPTKKKSAPRKSSALSLSREEEAQPTILIDTREPNFQAYDFTPYGSIATLRRKLSEGDYSLAGFEGRVAVERKTLNDFASSVQLERFWEELGRAQKACYARFAVVIEATLEQAAAEAYNSQIKSAAVLGAAVVISARYGFPVIWAGTRQDAAAWTASYLLRIWKERAEIFPELLAVKPAEPVERIPGEFPPNKEGTQ